jgi:hypothetical protein
VSYADQRDPRAVNRSTFEQLLKEKRLAARFANEQIFGIGSTVRDFVRNIETGLPWYEGFA